MTADTQPAAFGRSAPAPSGGPALVSRLAGDPDMAELVRMFVDEIPARVDLVRDYWERREWSELRRIAHQLKGACGGYGFPEVGDAAGRLEQTLHDAGVAGDLEINVIAGRVGELVDLCQRVRTA